MPVSHNNNAYSKLMTAKFQSSNTINSGNTELSDMGNILETEKNLNKKEPWCKLNQTEKVQKLKEYAEKLSVDKSLTKIESTKLYDYLINALNKKRLQKVKDVAYDKEKGLIKSIPMLQFSNTDRRFTLKRGEKRISTTKSLGMGRTRKKTGASKTGTSKTGTSKTDTSKTDTSKTDTSKTDTSKTGTDKIDAES